MLNFALVGMGRWGTKLVAAIQDKSAKARFAAVVSRTPERVTATAAGFGLRVHTDLADVLYDTTIDAVVLATPHSQHAEQIAACAAAGKATFVEKPFTLSARSAAQAIAAARAAGIVLCAGHNRRFLPGYVEMQRMIAAGELGEILHIEANFSDNGARNYPAGHWRLAAGESPAGGLAGSGIHMIDAIIGLAGPVARVYASSARRVAGLPLNDTTTALFTLASGATASLANMTSTSPIHRLQVFGTNGSVELRDVTSMERRSLERKVQHISFEPFDTERAELDAFADAVAGRQPYPIPLDDVQNGVAVFEAIVDSARLRGPVDVGPAPPR